MLWDSVPGLLVNFMALDFWCWVPWRLRLEVLFGSHGYCVDILVDTETNMIVSLMSLSVQCWRLCCNEYELKYEQAIRSSYTGA